jgi:hypothetical protein
VHPVLRDQLQVFKEDKVLKVLKDHLVQLQLVQQDFLEYQDHKVRQPEDQVLRDFKVI